MGGVNLPAPAKVLLMLGVLPAIIGALLWIMAGTLKSVETKIDGHVLKNEILIDHLDEEQRIHHSTITILRQMCVMEATTAQERRDCLK